MSPISQVEWYVAKPGPGSQLKGPFTEGQLGEGLRSGEISWTDSAWNVHLGTNWRRIMDIPLLRQFQPELANAALIQKIAEVSPKPQATRSEINIPEAQEPSRAVKTPAKKEKEPDVWFLNYEGSKFGPLSAEEVCQILSRGKLGGNVLGWTEGMEKWIPLFDVPEFKDYFLTGKLPVGRLEKRKSRRRPLVATVHFTRIRDDGTKSPNTYSGICRDISTGGMRINTSQVPNKPGMKFHLSVEPMDTNQIPPFQVEAEVTRISDQESFALKFLNLIPTIADQIQEYVIEWYAKPPKIELETKK